MHSLEQAAEQAEELLESTQTRPERLLDPASQASKWKSLYQRLIDLYVEENKKEPSSSKLKCTSHLLDKLVAKEHLNTLVINLYPGDEGYSLMLKGRSGADSETIRLPYEESELLDYIDAEQLPPLLVDLLDRVQANIFHCGCVIAEIHDYRRSVNDSYDTQYVLLRPTPQTLLCDINAMTSLGHRWTQEDKFSLESQLLLNTHEPLCLDPSPAVCIVANRLQHNKHILNQRSLKRSMKKFSQVAIKRRKTLSQCSAPKHLKLYDFLNKKKDKAKNSPPVNLKVGKTCVDMWRQRDVQLATPETIEVKKFAKMFERPKPTTDNTLVVVEEYTFETERSHGKVYFSRLTIKQHLNEEFYHGQLYVDRDYVEGKSQGSTCKFSLGAKSKVEKYIRQFREIFTEEGRRQVKITHQVQGQRPTVTYTQNLHSVMSSQAAASNQGNISKATNLAATITGQLGAASDTSSKKPAAPIRFSLSLQPPLKVTTGDVSATQATPATAQLTLNLPQQQLAAAQRIRQMNIYQGLQRSGVQGNAQTTTSTTSGLAGTITAVQMSPASKSGSMGGKTSGPAPTRTPPPPQAVGGTSGLRRLSAVEGMSHPLQLNISGSIVQALSGRHTQSTSAPPTPSGDTTGDIVTLAVASTTDSGSAYASGQSSETGGQSRSAASSPPAGVSVPGSSASNISIQNLTGIQGVNLAGNMQGLQNVQVSLAGVPAGIAVPVPITPGGIFVGSIPGASASTGQSGAKSSAASAQSSGGSLVTMVTAVPSSRGTSETSVATTQVPVTTAVMSSAGMLSVPINVAGNLTQLMTTGLKGSSGIRAGTPLLLSQIPGQPGQQVQLLNPAHLGRGQAVTLTTQTGGKTSASTTTTTSVLTAQSIVTAPVSLSQLQPGQAQMLTAQQLAQLSSHQQLVQLSSQQQLGQLTLQQTKQGQGQPQKFTIQQIAQQGGATGAGGFLSQKLIPQQLQISQTAAGAVLTPVTATGGATHKSKSKKKSSSSSSSSHSTSTSPK